MDRVLGRAQAVGAVGVPWQCRQVWIQVDSFTRTAFEQVVQEG